MKNDWNRFLAVLALLALVFVLLVPFTAAHHRPDPECPNPNPVGHCPPGKNRQPDPPQPEPEPEPPTQDPPQLDVCDFPLPLYVRLKLGCDVPVIRGYKVIYRQN